MRAMKKIIIKTQNKEQEAEIVNEIEMLKAIDHPNIVKVFEFYNTEGAYYIILEYCKGGELFDKIVDNAPYSEQVCAYLMY